MEKEKRAYKLQTEMDIPCHFLITECTIHWGTCYKKDSLNIGAGKSNSSSV